MTISLIPTNRFIIPKIKVNAPISFKKVEKDGVLPMPNSPDDIEYFDFSLFPGLGGKVGEFGNAIFSGHVDSGFDYCDFGKTPPPCAAVLYHLDELTIGDKVNILMNEKKYTYEVLMNKRVKPSGKPWDRLFLSTVNESITIFTCAGRFDEKTHSYLSRQVVKALRIHENK